MKTKKKEKLSWDRVVEITKNHVAKVNGFSNLFGTNWKTAMLLTHRKKIQIDLYEAVIKHLGFYFTEQEKKI